MKKFEIASIKKSIPMQGIGSVVLIDCKMAPHCENDSNVFLLGLAGEVIWQIEPSLSSHGVIGYSDVCVGSNNKLLAYSSNGIEYEIEPTSGRILSKELIR